MKGDPILRFAGGHGHAGQELSSLDLGALETAVAGLAGQVVGFAVASRFATRNPAHEIAARSVNPPRHGRPVTCSHELSANLNGPKRALTARAERPPDRDDRPAGVGLRNGISRSSASPRP